MKVQNREISPTYPRLGDCCAFCYENQDIRQLKSCDIHNIHAIILRFQIVGSMARYLDLVGQCQRNITPDAGKQSFAGIYPYAAFSMASSSPGLILGPQKTLKPECLHDRSMLTRFSVISPFERSINYLYGGS